MPETKHVFYYDIVEMARKTRSIMPWLKGTWIPAEEEAPLIRNVYRLEVQSWLYSLIKPVLESDPITAFAAFYLGANGMDVSAEIEYLVQQGFRLECHHDFGDNIKAAPHELYGGHMVFSEKDGAHFAWKNEDRGMELDASFVPKRCPMIELDIVHEGTKYKTFAREDGWNELGIVVNAAREFIDTGKILCNGKSPMRSNDISGKNRQVPLLPRVAITGRPTNDVE